MFECKRAFWPVQDLVLRLTFYWWGLTGVSLFAVDKAPSIMAFSSLFLLGDQRIPPSSLGMFVLIVCMSLLDVARCNAARWRLIESLTISQDHKITQDHNITTSQHQHHKITRSQGPHLWTINHEKEKEKENITRSQDDKITLLAVYTGTLNPRMGLYSRGLITQEEDWDERWESV
jgi:hypothetical protein